MNTKIIEQVSIWAGDLRRNTFTLAAQHIVACNTLTNLVETGCYRGNPADGQSTLILALLAKHNGGVLDSYELNPQHIVLAEDLLRQHGLRDYVTFHQGNSVDGLQTRKARIDFAYLDSFDFWQHNPEPSQRHALQEFLQLLPNLSMQAAVLIDDCDRPHGGKGGMIEPVVARVMKMQMAGRAYQTLYKVC